MRISKSISLLIVVQCCVVVIQATPKSASLYSKAGQLVTSNTLGWQSFTGDVKQLEYAVEAAKFQSEHENYSMYVCRAVIEGIFVTGHTLKRDEHIICIVSMHTDVRTHHVFDVLLNKGNAGKLTWKPWSKYSATIPNGAVSATTAGHVSSIFHIYFSIFYVLWYWLQLSSSNILIEFLVSTKLTFLSLHFLVFNRLKIIMLHDEKRIQKMHMNTIIIIMALLITMLDAMHRNKVLEKLLSA